MNRRALGRGIGERVHVRHHVVSEALLVLRCRIEIDRGSGRAHLGDRRLRNRDAELHL